MLFSTDKTCTGEIKQSALLEADSELVVAQDAPSYALLAALSQDPQKSVDDFWAAFPAKRLVYSRLVSAETKARALISTETGKESAAVKAVATAQVNLDTALEQLDGLNQTLAEEQASAGYAPQDVEGFRALDEALKSAEEAAVEAQAVLRGPSESDPETEVGLEVDIRSLTKLLADLNLQLASLKKSADSSDLDLEVVQIDIDNAKETLDQLQEERATAAAILADANAELKTAEANMTAFIRAYDTAFSAWIRGTNNASTKIVSDETSTKDQQDAYSRVLKVLGDITTQKKTVAARESALALAEKNLDGLKAAADAASAAVTNAREEAEGWVAKWKLNNKAVWMTATPADSQVVVVGSRADGKVLSYSGPLIEVMDGDVVTQKIVASLNGGDGIIVAEVAAALTTESGVDIGANAAEVSIGVTANRASVVDANRKSRLLVDVEDGDGEGLGFYLKNGKVRVVNRSVNNAAISGSSFTLSNGLLSGVVGAIGTEAAYPVFGLFARFGEDLAPKLFVSDGSENKFYELPQ